MRVLIAVPSLDPGFGGPQVKALALAQALRELGASVLVAGAGSGAPGLGLLALRPIGRFHGSPIPAQLVPLWRELGKADVMHLLGYRDPVGIAAALGARALGIPYLFEPCGMHRVRLRSLRLKRVFDAGPGRLIAEGAVRIVATSALEARELAEDGVAAGRIAVRANGLALDGLLPLPERGVFRRWEGIPEEAPLVLHFGRIAAKKGLLELTGALAHLPGVYGVVAGPDDCDGTLARVLSLRHELGLAERLHVLPRGFWGKEKAGLIADADVFALPSATENFGNAAAEAAAAGLPVAISDACGVSEFLDQGACRVVRPQDPRGLARALSELLTKEARDAAEAAAPRLRETLDWGPLSRRQLELYEEATRCSG